MFKPARITLLISFALIPFCVQCADKGSGSGTDRMTDSEQAQDRNADPQSSYDPYMNREITESRQNAITRAVHDVSPAVVGINVTQIQQVRSYSPFFDEDPLWGWFFSPREYQKVKSLGSGFLISPDGYILTNEHVVHDASEIIVTTTSGKQIEAKIAGSDVTYDVALLKIDATNLPFIPLGDSEDLLIGEWVIALGNPFGLFDINMNPTVTVGVISAVGMNFKGQYQIEDRIYTDMIQTDAAINGGNSGGPLVNSLGQCIGINTFIFSGSSQKTSIGIGFAIPINRVKRILPDLKTVGQVDRSFKTGLEVENINYLVARMLGINPGDGVIVTRVKDGSTAEKAGIQVGDVIVSMEDQRIRSTRDIQHVVNGVDVTVQSEVALKIFRKNKLVDITLELER
ncbi:trypsin-like peptidase domain-containing protein [bacterium]|nr:trypsin-like peptidase domain-containing protein [bacterium]